MTKGYYTYFLRQTLDNGVWPFMWMSAFTRKLRLNSKFSISRGLGTLLEITVKPENQNSDLTPCHCSMEWWESMVAGSSPGSLTKGGGIDFT